MNALSLPMLAYLALAGLVGFAMGFLLGALRRSKLRAELDLKEHALQANAQLETERERAFELATERLNVAFGRLANEQLQSHSETFLRLARESLTTHHERAQHELEAREKAVEHLVQPIREALQRTETQMRELEKARLEAQGGIAAQLEAMAATQKALGAETRNLVNALRRPEVRGQWGEITLRRLVELAGMVEHCDFVTQSHRATPEGAIRPDMVVNLPEGRQLIVDVKTPLDAYLEATQAPDDAARQSALARHAAIVAERIRDLASKTYWAQFERSPEFVILFIPGDQFLSAALEQRPTLLDDALRQQVILATPTSFVALLKAVAYGWQQSRLAENASEVRRLAVQLHDRLGSFVGHLAQLGKELTDSVAAYNRAVGSLERSVLPSARRFTELGVKPRERLADLKPLEAMPREPSASQEPNETATSEEPGAGAPLAHDPRTEQ
jgi:DNA recombination protein RmuC